MRFGVVIHLSQQRHDLLLRHAVSFRYNLPCYVPVRSRLVDAVITVHRDEPKNKETREVTSQYNRMMLIGMV